MGTDNLVLSLLFVMSLFILGSVLMKKHSTIGLLLWALGMSVKLD